MNPWPRRIALLGCLFATTTDVFADENAVEAAKALEETPITDDDRSHWAFCPLLRPPAPAQDDLQSRTPVDAFVLAKLKPMELTFASPADRRTLIRRATFDLTGLPPTPEELQAFENDRRPDAYERLVDRLLASPAHGEHQAQAWLDLASFAETDGFEHDRERNSAWQYRDWVINAFNHDLPYDDFVGEQLAGDLREGGSGIATMFCLAGPDMPDLNDQHERRHFRMNQLTATVGSSLLGMQMACAECHDHKYDPLSQADFYRFRGLFETAVAPLKRDAAYNVLAKQAEPLSARFWVRGDARRPGPELPVDIPRVLAGVNGAPLPTDKEPRLALAEWLADRRNPVFARVAVNRLWQQHFGRGIFDTPSDVGVINAGPTHSELLDWLATEYREGGWSGKALHRLIVTSAAYRQASRRTADDRQWDRRRELDPDARWLSRYPRQRLSGESIRDAMLSASELLSFEARGPGVRPPLPDELVRTLLKNQWNVSPRLADHYRRSIYLFARRNLRYPLFEAFDRPDGNASCPARNRSTTAPQALVLFNSELSHEVAAHWAQRTLTDASNTRDWTARLWRRGLGREPTPSEQRELTEFVDRISQDDPTNVQTIAAVCLALLNTNEFSYID